MARDILKLTEKGRALIELPVQKGRELVRHIPEPVQIGLSKLSHRSLLFTLEIFAGLFVVCLVMMALAYGRLNQGPMSLASLVPILEDAINREMADVEVKIDDAILQRDKTGPGVNFRLRNIRLIDKKGAVVAQAPLAAIGLSGKALLSGKIAPGSVDFIGPRLLMFQTAEGVVSLSFTRDAPNEASAEKPSASDGQPASAEPGISIIGGPNDINISQTIAAAFDQARKRKTASAYLSRFGVRDAVVIFDQLGKQSFWQVPDFSIDLDHKKKESIILGRGAISSATGPWKFNFRTEQSAKHKRLTFTALIQDLVPTGLAANFPGFPALQALNLPLSAKTSVHLSTSGKLLGAEAKVDVASGQIILPWDRKYPVSIDKGELHVRYEANNKRIDILPSKIEWGKSHATISGFFSPVKNQDNENLWAFELKADDALFGVEQFGLEPTKVQRLDLKGTVDKKAGRVVLQKFTMQMKEGLIEFGGTVVDALGSPEIKLAGNFSPMSLDILLKMWPKFVAAGAREWVGERVSAGQLTSGSFEIDLKPGELAKLQQGGDIPESAVIVDLAATGLELMYIEGLPPVQTADATLQLRGRSMEFDAPQAWVILPSGKKIMLGAGHFKVADLRPLPEIGELEFATKGSAEALLELLDHKPLGFVSEAGLKPSDVGGKTEGKFKLVLPLIKGLEFSDVKLQGTINLEEATLSGAVGGANVEGGEVTFKVTEQAFDAQGDLLVNGVPAVLSWQRIFDAPLEKQPELRLSTVLDELAREKLGIKINHMLRGPVPTIVSIDQKSVGTDAKKVHVQADLGGAELILTNVGWRKPRGRGAVLGFDVGKGVEGGTELQNFRIIGDDIAIDGWISLAEDNWPNAFFFPNFSFNVITHMEVSGKLSKDNVWKVQANGPAYDGRQFFRSLFSSGQLADDQPLRPESAPGLELKARIGTMVGFFDTTVKDVTINLAKRKGRMQSLNAKGLLNGKSEVAVKIVDGGQSERVLLAESDDAGSAFRLIGFYPRMEGGQTSLKVMLDAQGLARKTGTLWARDFTVLGDTVISEVISNVDDDSGVAFGRQGGGERVARRQRIPFDQLEVPFSVGGGQFVLHNSYVNGPQLGATIRGNVDIKNRVVDLGGTFIPLYGLNSALGSIPIIGNILVGRRGEGIVGITYTVRGSTGNPRVQVNPLSIVAPGIFRQIFEFTGRTPSAFPQPPRPRAQTRSTEELGSPFDPDRFGGISGPSN
jgi:hypothetical protein